MYIAACLKAAGGMRSLWLMTQAMAFDGERFDHEDNTMLTMPLMVGSSLTSSCSAMRPGSEVRSLPVSFAIICTTW